MRKNERLLLAHASRYLRSLWVCLSRQRSRLANGEGSALFSVTGSGRILLMKSEFYSGIVVVEKTAGVGRFQRINNMQ